MSIGKYNKILFDSPSMTDHRKFSEPVRSPMIPTGKDYRSGKFTRYFCKHNIDGRIVEIDNVQYGSILKPTQGIDQNYWKGIKMRWKLKGPRFDQFLNGVLQKRGVVSVNQERVDKILKKHPSFIKAIPSMITYATLDPEIRERLFANPGQLVYKNNPDLEYVGYYHFHPEKGPMEGAVHRDEPHALLQFVEGFNPFGTPETTTAPTPTPTTTVETQETMPDTSPPDTSTTTPTYTPPPSMGGSSGGGGGGGGGY